MKAFIVLFLTSDVVWAAAEHAEHMAGEEGIPRSVFWQAVNIGILAITVFFILRKKVVQFFNDRRSNFVDSAKKSQKVQEEAEKSYLDLKHKLDVLTSTTDESIARARAQANDLKRSLIRDAEDMAQKVMREAQENMKVEVEKAKFHLREQTVLNAIAQAKQVLQKDVGQSDHQNLQNKFVASLKDVQI